MEEYKGMPFIGEMAPEFHAVTTQGEINFPQDYHGSWVVFFSHPADFTPVCTTELMVFASMVTDFKAIGTELIGLSIDSVYSHIAWLRKIKELSWKDLKHLEVTFPIIADTGLEISKKYGMIHKEGSSMRTSRAVFIIDPDGRIRAILYYPSSTGRNVNEIKRMVIALQKSDNEGMVTPANWQPGDDMILPTPGTYALAGERMEQVGESVYTLDWFMSFRQSGNEVITRSLDPEVNPYPSMNPAKNRYGNRR